MSLYRENRRVSVSRISHNEASVDNHIFLAPFASISRVLISILQFLLPHDINNCFSTHGFSIHTIYTLPLSILTFKREQVV